MSWVFGYIGKENTDQRQFGNLFKKSLYNHFSHQFIIAAGGNKNTCIFGKENTIESGFIVCGLGINQNKPSLLDANEWEKLFENHFNPDQVDGHFITVRWADKTLEIHTDILGLRDIYLYQSNNKIILSTNILWFKKFFELKINYRAFGSRWLLYNQISSESIFKDIRRITAGQHLVINRSDLSIKEEKRVFIPFTNSKINTSAFSEKLSSIILFPLTESKNLSLSLSGGMDSRVLLSYLLKNNLSNWDIHTFGSENHPDRIVVDQIVKELKIKHTFIDLPLLPKNNLIDQLKEYINFSLVCKPSSEICQLNNYSYFFDKDYVIIDGGFGELWRRKFLNKLQYQGFNAIKNKNSEEIMNYLTLHKGDIFSSEIKEEMLEGCKEQISQLISEMPSYKEIKVGNWLDLFALKTRLINLYSHEQTRLDQNIICYMPFVQLSLLKYLFSINVSGRKNAKLYRYIIKKNNKKLMKFSLAKGICTYPYRLTTLQSRIWAMAIKKSGRAYFENRQLHFLHYLSDYIQDTIHSQDVKEYPYYNYEYIQNICNRFYNGETSYSNELDWFLAFELLRQIIDSKT